MKNLANNAGSWSFRLGRILGIDVYIHLTFLLLLGVVAAAHGLSGGGWASALAGLTFFGGVFLCVLLHEFGHALAARRYGIRTHDITLLPIGGLARLERIPDKPIQELVVALAGPAVNVVIAAGLLAGFWLGGHGWSLGSLSATGGHPLERLLVANVFLALFNLIPAFPMDGGRVLRSLLALRLPLVRATRIAATIGKGIAVVFGFLGLFSNPMLLLIALFVWIGATQEANAVTFKSTFEGIPVREAMLTQFETLSPRTTLGEATRALLAGSQQDFPVVERGEVVGMLPRDLLFDALRAGHENHLVSEVMERQFPSARPDELLDAVLGRSLPERPVAIPVLLNGRITGLLTPENVGELYMISAAIRQRRTSTVRAEVGELSRGGLVDRPSFARSVASPLHD